MSDNHTDLIQAIQETLGNIRKKHKELESLKSLSFEQLDRKTTINDLASIHDWYASLLKEDLTDERLLLLKRTLDLAYRIIDKHNKISVNEIKKYEPDLQKIARMALWDENKTNMYYSLGATGSLLLTFSLVAGLIAISILTNPVGIASALLSLSLLLALHASIIVPGYFTLKLLGELLAHESSNYENINRFFQSKQKRMESYTTQNISANNEISEGEDSDHEFEKPIFEENTLVQYSY